MSYNKSASDSDAPPAYYAQTIATPGGPTYGGYGHGMDPASPRQGAPMYPQAPGQGAPMQQQAPPPQQMAGQYGPAYGVPVGTYASPQQGYPSPPQQQQVMQVGYLPNGQAVLYPMNAGGGGGMQPPTAAVVGVMPMPQGHNIVVVQGGPEAPPPDDDWGCALCGLCFSFIPLVGWITFCVNVGAPVGTKRRKFGILAGIIATAFFVLWVALSWSSRGR